MKDNRRGFLKKTGLAIAGLVGAGTAKTDIATAQTTLTPPDQPDASKFADDFAYALTEIRTERIDKIIAKQDAKLRNYVKSRRVFRDTGTAYIDETGTLPMPKELQDALRIEKDSKG